MKYSNLKNCPEYVEKTVDLIEKAFDYTNDNSFKTDFYPLMKEGNHKNCHIYIDKNEVVAHIGALTKKLVIDNKEFEFTMFGGIAVNETYRGQGLFKKLFTEVTNIYNNQAFYLLWSEKTELYKKLGFYPCGQLNQYNKSQKKQTQYMKSNFKELSANELREISSLYANTKELRPVRSEEDWKDLKEMTSMELYLKKENNKIVNYFLMNKGADLTGIIHEYGTIDQDLLTHGTLWTPQIAENLSPTYLNAFLLKPGEAFNSFIELYSNIKIKNINEFVSFEFNQQCFEMPLSDFLPGIYGPGRFEELTASFLFIPGPTSI